MSAIKYGASAVIGAILAVGTIWTQVPWALGLAANWYCSMVSTEDQDKLRDGINEALRPHAIELTCGQDGGISDRSHLGGE